MPVYPAHKLIHIHIPKTGGTAIETYFHQIGDLQWNPEFWVGQQRKNDRWYEYQHLSMQELRSLASSTLDAYDSFTVVRNPYARMISDYVWRQHIRARYPESATQFFDSFDAFLGAVPTDMDGCWSDHIRNVDQRWANFLIHVRPQHQYIFDTEGNCLVEHMLRFEHLARDMNRLLRRYGSSTTALQTPRERDIAAYYDRRLLDLVNLIYAKDFECFCYEKL